MEINAKRVQRLWRLEGLKVPRHQRKRQRLGSSEGGTQRLRAERVNHVWSYDFIFDQTEDGRRLKWLPICDEFSRELVALEVERRMDAKDVIRILDEAVLARGCVPEFIRSDNGPEFIALAVQDWIARRGFATLYIKPGAPWQNAYSESFNSRFRDEFLNRELFGGLTEAKVLGKQHRHWHNQQRPHSSLDDQTPAEFAQRSPIRPLMNIFIANGSHGYLPTPAQHQLGGYETWIGVNKVQLDASVKMVNALVEMLGELHAKKP